MPEGNKPGNSMLPSCKTKAVYWVSCENIVFRKLTVIHIIFSSKHNFD